jgi:hypothetical protein
MKWVSELDVYVYHVGENAYQMKDPQVQFTRYPISTVKSLCNYYLYFIQMKVM